MAATEQPAGDAATFEVAYNEAARALTEQLALFDSFRNRAGWLLSAAAITTSVLGARALDGGSIGLASWIALSAFAAVALLSMAILWPRSREFATDSVLIIENCIESSDSRSLANLYYALTIQIRRSCSANRKELGQLATFFELAACLLAVEILSWIAAIPSTG